jgi:hypothetical protein
MPMKRHLWSVIAASILAGTVALRAQVVTNVDAVGVADWIVRADLNGLGSGGTNSRAIEFVSGPAANLGGALHLEGGPLNLVTLSKSGATAFGTLASFIGGYRAYQENAGAPGPSFKLELFGAKVVGSSVTLGWQGNLVFEPYLQPGYTNPNEGVWRDYADIQAGDWWWTGTAQGTEKTIPDWVTYIAANPLGGSAFDALYVATIQLSVGGTGVSSFTGGYFDYVDYGFNGATITNRDNFVAIPESSTCVAILGLAVLGFAAFRRFRQCG